MEDVFQADGAVGKRGGSKIRQQLSLWQTSTSPAILQRQLLLLWFKDGSELWNLTSSGGSVPGTYTIHLHIYTIYVHIHTKVKYCCALSLEYSPSAKSET